jgi:hypothetical protein
MCELPSWGRRERKVDTFGLAGHLDHHEAFSNERLVTRKPEQMAQITRSEEQDFGRKRHQQPQTEQRQTQLGMWNRRDQLVFQRHDPGENARPNHLRHNRTKQRPQRIASEIEIGRDARRQPGLHGFQRETDTPATSTAMTSAVNRPGQPRRARVKKKPKGT